MHQYIRSLDGVRAIAILLVMAMHFEISSFGWMGVQLFFVLSGFLISGILLAEKEKAGSLGQKLKKFWIRRSLRIFPVYYLFLAGAAVIYLIWRMPDTFTRDIPYLATYTFNYLSIIDNFHAYIVFQPFWSLCVEEQFYLFFPFVVLLLSRRALKSLTIVMLIAGPVWRVLFSLYLMNAGKPPVGVFDAVYTWTPSHLDAFFTGMAIHLWDLPRRIQNPARMLGTWSAVAFLIGAASYVVYDNGESFIRSLGYGFRASGTWQQVWFFTVLNILFALLLLTLTSVHKGTARQWLDKALENRVMVELGKVSYGMYIYHMAIQTLVIEEFFDLSYSTKFILFVPYIALVYGFSWLSFRFVEAPFIRLKDRLTAPSAAGPKVQQQLSESRVGNV